MKLRIGNVIISYAVDYRYSANPVDWNYQQFKTSRMPDFHLIRSVKPPKYGKKVYSSKMFATKWFIYMQRESNTILFAIKPGHKNYFHSLEIGNGSIKSFFSDPLLHNGSKFLLAQPADSIVSPYLHSQINKGELYHCSHVVIKNKSYLFLGKSGSGKSTIATLFDKYFSLNKNTGIVVNDEKNIVSVTDFKVSGSPWGGSADFRNPHTGQLDGIFFIKKEKFCSINDLSRIKAFFYLQQVHYAPFGIKDYMEQSADNMLKLIDVCPPKIFKFAKSMKTPEWFMKNVVERES